MTRLALLNKYPEGYMWVQARLTKKEVTTRPGNILLEEWLSMLKNSQRKAVNKWAEEEPKLDTAREHGSDLVQVMGRKLKRKGSILHVLSNIMRNTILNHKNSNHKRYRTDSKKHISDRGHVSMSHCNLVRKPISIPKAMTSPAARIVQWTNSRANAD